jgi:tRNA pseudouridine38-40 synthase
MERIKLTIEYDGKNFSGYQIQPEKRTIQGEIQKVLEFLLNEKVTIYASGRTDAGVSALGQVAHFDTEQEINTGKLEASLNALLPKDIAVKKVEKVSETFDARFSVKKKTYDYLFYVSRYELPLFEGRALRINDYADIVKMNEAAKYFVGTHDFSSFVARKSGKTDFVRTIYDAKIVEISNGLYAFEITGNGFLYNMVRIAFGTILLAGYNKIEPSELKNIIDAKSRSRAGKTMPAYALVMKSVEYEGEN